MCSGKAITLEIAFRTWLIALISSLDIYFSISVHGIFTKLIFIAFTVLFFLLIKNSIVAVESWKANTIIKLVGILGRTVSLGARMLPADETNAPVATAKCG